MNTTTLTYKIHAIGAGKAEVAVVSAYDFCIFEDCQYLSITINGLDSWEGQIVYVTPTGEKYHLSSDCAGENYITTTRYDAELQEDEPCKKCAG